MNIGMLLIFLVAQIVVNNVLNFAFSSLGVDGIYGIIAYYMLSSLIIAFIGSFLLLPKAYRKDFMKQPGFHKTMLSYFLIFLAMDLVFLWL